MEIFLLEQKGRGKGGRSLGNFYCFILSGGSCQNVIVIKNGIRYAKERKKDTHPSSKDDFL
jgi:hypothetical protein